MATLSDYVAATFKDRVWETTATTGTGTYALAGAVSGYAAFSDIGNGNTCVYCVTDDVDWEIGIGTYTAAGTTLARTEVLRSSNSNAAVNWGAGTKNVFVVMDAGLIAALLAALPSGDIVGTTDTQTLSGKTLSTPTINQPTLILAQGTTQNPTAEGDIRWDTDEHRLRIGTGGGTETFRPTTELESTNNGFGASIIGVEDAAGRTAQTTVEGYLDENRAAIDAIEADYYRSSDLGVTLQQYDADTLKADTADVLTAGFAGAPYNAGTQSSGTFTPNEANGNLQYAVNGGAHTLAPPTNNCSIVVQYTNNASAGAITTSGFTIVDGDAFDTVNGNNFFAFIMKNNGFSSLTVKALQ